MNKVTYCKCEFKDSNGTVVLGEPCDIHPSPVYMLDSVALSDIIFRLEGYVQAPGIKYQIRDDLADAIAEIKCLRANAGTQVHAVIKRTSKYRHQQLRAEGSDVPFSVRFTNDVSYPVRGNDNNYRIEDLRFYVRPADHFIALS